MRNAEMNHHTMNLSTLIRHGLTYLAGIGGFLYQHGAIDAGAVDVANQAGEQLIDPLSVILGLVAAVVMRLVIALLGKIFPSLAEKASGGMSGGALLLMAMGTMAGVMGCLPSCSLPNAEGGMRDAEWRMPPLRISVTGPDARASYSSKGGVEVSAVVRHRSATPGQVRATK